jgi:hypothetical protein
MNNVTMGNPTQGPEMTANSRMRMGWEMTMDKKGLGDLKVPGVSAIPTHTFPNSHR